MFPIPFNFPFRKKDGSLTSIGDAISSGGGSYTLPTASAETKGGVKVGSGLSMSGEVLNNSNPTPYTLPTASAETKGGVKVGSGLSIDENGVLSTSGGGGGGSKYCHVVNISTGNIVLATTIINNSSTPFNQTSLLKFLTDNGFNGTNKFYPVSGKTAVTPTIALGLGYANSDIKIYDASGNWTTVSSGISDVVIEI